MDQLNPANCEDRICNQNLSNIASAAYSSVQLWDGVLLLPVIPSNTELDDLSRIIDGYQGLKYSNLIYYLSANLVDDNIIRFIHYFSATICLNSAFRGSLIEIMSRYELTLDCSNTFVSFWRLYLTVPALRLEIHEIINPTIASYSIINLTQFEINGFKYEELFTEALTERAKITKNPADTIMAAIHTQKSNTSQRSYLVKDKENDKYYDSVLDVPPESQSLVLTYPKNINNTN